MFACHKSSQSHRSQASQHDPEKPTPPKGHIKWESEDVGRGMESWTCSDNLIGWVNRSSRKLQSRNAAQAKPAAPFSPINSRYFLSKTQQKSYQGKNLSGKALSMLPKTKLNCNISPVVSVTWRSKLKYSTGNQNLPERQRHSNKSHMPMNPFLLIPEALIVVNQSIRKRPGKDHQRSIDHPKTTQECTWDKGCSQD